MAEVIAEQVLEGLTKQRFADWYTTRFERFISEGPDSGITQEQVIEDIIVLFKLEK